MLSLSPTRRSRAAGSCDSALPIPHPAKAVDWAALERRYLTPKRLSLALDLLIDDIAAQLWPGIARANHPAPQPGPRHPLHTRARRSPGRTANPRR